MKYRSTDGYDIVADSKKEAAVTLRAIRKSFEVLPEEADLTEVDD